MMGDKPVYISFDIDGLDPAYAPGTGKSRTVLTSVRNNGMKSHSRITFILMSNYTEEVGIFDWILKRFPINYLMYYVRQICDNCHKSWSAK